VTPLTSEPQGNYIYINYIWCLNNFCLLKNIYVIGNISIQSNQKIFRHLIYFFFKWTL